jgi:poly(A) polymerase Pap1
MMYAGGTDKKSVKLSEDLEQLLRGYNLYEPEADARKRERVLGQLNRIVQQWVMVVSTNRVRVVRFGYFVRSTLPSRHAGYGRQYGSRSSS